MALTNVVVSDPIAPGCDATFASLSVGQTVTTSCSIVVTGDVTNVASATALDPIGDTVDAGSDSGDVVALLPAVLVGKTPAAQAIGVGQDATFTITVSNTGDVTLVNIDVVDAFSPTCDRSVGPLLPGQSTSYDCTIADVLTDFTNTVEVTGVDANGNIVTSSDEADVTVVPGSISITKSPDATAVVDGGDIVYTITIENTGPADLVNVVVSDPSLPACDTTFATLLVGESQIWTCTDSAVDATLADPVVNSIAVVGVDEAGTSVSASATSSVDVLVPALTVTKTASPTMVTEGDDVVFAISVTNTGETPLTDVVVDDPSFPACDGSFAALAVGETESWNCTIVGLLANIVNTVDASATDPVGGTVADSASASVTVIHTGVVTGFVFTDEDRDGVYEPADGDAPVAGVDIVITNAAGVSIVVTTDATGTYGATLVVGDYTIDVDESDPDFPDDYAVETTGTDGQTVTVADAVPATAEPVGYGRSPVGALAGTIWHDLDADGVIDAGEPSLSGVTVTATGAGPDGVFETADDVVLTATTISGNYRFDDLPPGTYRVVVDSTTLPTGIDVATFDPDGILDGRTVVTVVADETSAGIDFGYVGPPNSPPVVLTLSVAGTVANQTGAGAARDDLDAALVAIL